MYTALKCENLKTLFNGKFEILPFNTFAARVRYTCESGYRLEGLSERICQGDGYWNGEAPVCVQDANAIPAAYQYEGCYPFTAKLSTNLSLIIINFSYYIVLFLQ